MKKQIPWIKPKPRNGFALIATILLMVLLAIITVGTLSLSVVTLRSGNQDSAQARARANARMALMIAIGELQKQIGPDQRISANSTILDESTVQHSNWLGVWNSWKAGLGEASQHSTIQGITDEMAPTYLPNRSDYFRKWLVSLNENEMSDISSPKNLTLNASPLPSSDDDAILLVAEGSLGTDPDRTSDYVAARILDVKDMDTSKVTGRYGWWVGDETQKALIMDDTYLSSPAVTSADKIYRSQAPGSMGTKTISGLKNVTDDSQFSKIPSLATLDLVANVDGRPSRKNFLDVTTGSFAVLSDVREGGLKRDLSVLLERPISRTETGNEFMLYKFNVKDAWANNPSYGLPNTPQECVPIQDLAAYYQLYDQSRKGGIEYNTADIKTTSPNYGTQTAPWKVTTDYSAMYRQPVPVKVQFVLSLHAEPITAADRAITHSYDPDGAGPLPSVTTTANLSIPAGDTHKLRLAVIPVVTMWNPYNVPLTMQSGAACQSFRVRSPSFYIGCVKTRSTGGNFTANPLNLTFAAVSSSITGGHTEGRADLMRLNFGYSGPPVSFKPGEVRVFSMPYGSSNTLYASGGNDYNVASKSINQIEATSGWNSTGFYTFTNSTPLVGNRNRTVPNTVLTSGECNVMIDYAPSTTTRRFSLTLADGDSFEFNINAEPATGSSSVTNMARTVAPAGSAMTHYMIQRNIGLSSYNYINLFNNSFITRMGRDTVYPGTFINEVMRQGTPGGVNSYPVEQIQASQIINASGGSTVPLMQFALMAGCEASLSVGEFGGRKYPMRPFLHSSVLAPTVIDKSDATAPYLHGWNWWMEDIGSILSALVNNTQGGEGYFGGGYTPEAGVTRAIQQEIPVAPPISIAALSHARLGGFTLANEAPVGEGKTGTGQMEGYGGGYNPLINHLVNPSLTLGFQRVTASGQGGLYPHTLQAIGNSYAHPMLDSNKAYNDNYDRIYDADDGTRKVVFADHSYLANKALWDDYFFSSITPQSSAISIFGSNSRTAEQVAKDFFFGDPVKPLPNRRITPFANRLDTAKLTELFTESTLYKDGLADKIAAHLMIEGAFNINSTSVEAWKVFLSSLRGKSVSYLNGGSTPQESPTRGTPVSGITLPISTPLTAPYVDSKNPAEQWLGLKELTDEEVEQLAQAIVKQIKKRGPFLSLSEFVNRRLESTTATLNPPDNLAVMGALQAALDDPSVNINQNFRDDPIRMLDSETSSLTFAFKAAAKGPTAYGSSTYVDQADILRHLGSQMTARGDTFVIRTYGDALDSKGKVLARAWCEAIIQRIPEYLDDQDNSYLKFNDLKSETNKLFGRKFVITGFRWLNSDEI